MMLHQELIDHLQTIYATLELLDERLESVEQAVARLDAIHNTPLLPEDQP